MLKPVFVVIVVHIDLCVIELLLVEEIDAGWYNYTIISLFLIDYFLSTRERLSLLKSQ